MTPRLAALAAALGALLAGLAGGGARSGPFGLEWPDWGQRVELDDLRHALEVHPPVAVERWLYNPGQRTRRGLDRLAAQGPGEALPDFEAAGRLAPHDRKVLFNLGTARLLADHGDAVTALERAVASVDADGEAVAAGRPLDAETLQRAWYNLGAARLADGDPAGAVAAFKEALRRDPLDTDAKFNLELALRRLEDRRLRLRPPQEAPGGRRPGEEERSDETGGSDPETAPEDESDAGRDPGGEGDEADTPPRNRAEYARGALAGFEEQRDLSSVQAAAILDAVENLERRQRRLEAARAARAAGASEEDW